MEPRGCNPWQPVANRSGATTAESSQNRCDRLRPVAAMQTASRAAARAADHGPRRQLHHRRRRARRVGPELRQRGQF